MSFHIQQTCRLFCTYAVIAVINHLQLIQNLLPKMRGREEITNIFTPQHPCLLLCGFLDSGRCVPHAIVYEPVQLLSSSGTSLIVVLNSDFGEAAFSSDVLICSIADRASRTDMFKCNIILSFYDIWSSVTSCILLFYSIQCCCMYFILFFQFIFLFLEFFVSIFASIFSYFVISHSQFSH